MTDLLNIRIAGEILDLRPGFRIHTFLFEGAHIAVGHRGLDTLRARVALRVRERLSGLRDVVKLPEVEAFTPLLQGLGSRGRPVVPIHATVIRAVARREPLPVVNDAVDGASVLSLYYLLPVLIFDAHRLAPPLDFLLAPPDLPLPGPHGPGPQPNAPALTDARGGLASLVSLSQRAAVTEATRTFLLLLFDPGLERGPDQAMTAHRAENWLSTLTGAHLTGSALNPA